MTLWRRFTESSEHGIGPRRIAGDGGGGITMPAHPYRLNIVMSISHRWWTMASGVFDLKQHCAGWSLCDIKVPRERYENIRIHQLFYRSYGTLMSHSYNSAQRCFKPNTPIIYRPTYGKCAGEGWAHSELREPRGERRQMLKRKPIFIQTRRCKLHIRVNRFIAQP